MTKDTEKQMADLGADMIDLASINETHLMNNPICVELKHPTTKAGLGQKVWLLGKDSDRVSAYINGEVNARLRKEADLSARGKQGEVPTVERAKARSIELLTVATVRWENVFFDGEANAEFTVAKAAKLYSQQWVRDQLAEPIGELENFMQG